MTRHGRLCGNCKHRKQGLTPRSPGERLLDDPAKPRRAIARLPDADRRGPRRGADLRSLRRHRRRLARRRSHLGSSAGSGLPEARCGRSAQAFNSSADFESIPARPQNRARATTMRPRAILAISSSSGHRITTVLGVSNAPCFVTWIPPTRPPVHGPGSVSCSGPQSGTKSSCRNYWPCPGLGVGGAGFEPATSTV